MSVQKARVLAAETICLTCLLNINQQSPKLNAFVIVNKPSNPGYGLLLAACLGGFLGKKRDRTHLPISIKNIRHESLVSQRIEPLLCFLLGLRLTLFLVCLHVHLHGCIFHPVSNLAFATYEYFSP